MVNIRGMILVLIFLVFVTGCTQQQPAETAKETSLDNKTTDNIVGQITEQEIAGMDAKETKGVVGGAAGSKSEEECNHTRTKRQFNSEPYYTGPLIDTHLHMPVASKTFSDIAIQSGFEDMPYTGQVPTSKIVCLMENEGITKAYGFFLAPNIGLGQSVDHVKEIKKKYPDKFVRFFQPPLPIQSLDPGVSEVEEIFKNNPDLYQGYGEVRFDFNVAKNALPEDEYLLEMYNLSDKYNLIVQIHPKRGQVDALERLLKKYPNVIFLAHTMPYEKAEVGRLMDKYDNLYYSLDAEIHYNFGYHTIQNNMGPTKEEYLKFTRENFDSLLEEGLNDWKPIIEAHPDRFTWGSDRWFTWHFDPEVGALIEEFGRSFIGRLDPAVQEKFAYKNAEKMLEEQ